MNNINPNESYKSSNQISYSQPFQSDNMNNLPVIDGDKGNNSFYASSKTLGDFEDFKA